VGTILVLQENGHNLRSFYHKLLELGIAGHDFVKLGHFYLLVREGVVVLIVFIFDWHLGYHNLLSGIQNHILLDTENKRSDRATLC